MGDIKHTPGPWKAIGKLNIITHTEAEVYGPDGDMVAMSYGNLGLGGDPMATASLIAAAPALLEALEAVEWAGGEYNRGCPYCGYAPGLNHREDCKLGNALKLVRGE